jgi:hypothetical protein
VEAGDGDTLGGGGSPNGTAPRRRQPVGLLAEREGGNLKTVVTDRARERALAFEREFAHHLVAQRNTHLACPTRL